MNNPFDYWPGEECEVAFRELTEYIEGLRSGKLKLASETTVAEFLREIEAGKMLGVLIADDPAGKRHRLFAFSGQIGRMGFRFPDYTDDDSITEKEEKFPGFVEPVFDYLQPTGYFKSKEREISRMNREIEVYERGKLAAAKEDYEIVKRRGNERIAEFKEICRRRKAERDALREKGLSPEREQEMIGESQFDKAELHRLKKRVAAELTPWAEKLASVERELAEKKERRRKDSEALQRWLFDNFMVMDALGESRSLSDIFAETPMRIPPSGAGECCAPKLLQAAYRRGWMPVEIAEYWYGRPKGGEIRRHGEHYPACRGKCLPVLNWMLRGLSVDPPLGSDLFSTTPFQPRIIFENEWFCVIDKPSGMLSVPGKGAAVSVQEWLCRREKRGSKGEVKPAHRLDQDTSGLLIATYTPEAYKAMQALFATRKVMKTYIAELEGDYEALGIKKEGRIDLPLSPDLLDRPRQRVDFESGKEAVTEYEFIGKSGGRSRILFHPLTGRTHQLRMHAASEHGLSMPIAGDRLYGRRSVGSTERLRLHARSIEFTFPLDGKHYLFESPEPF